MNENLRLNIVLIPFTLRRDLDRISLGDDADITLEVSLGSPAGIVGIRQQGPFMVELMVLKQRQKIDTNSEAKKTRKDKNGNKIYM